ncbi:uncharacterized protein ASCRUDRAFT_7450 [Ascoidea rubescens DSM 1968]|uniref:DRBM domain-containing protein n=1 Tax=Ascoidea rubescens DSM 1968 TaxID=1344418 RepID=A0A1D2VK60_9ASCO|nr:hypothetical protein ASCRUDRAFT_7450 [Ascoidea rubescens DSM 1968]ODV62000.1 hypothetical protein ASCRUDRAFT_7450 [Ascoidea rubescens DSM 1968]
MVKKSPTTKRKLNNDSDIEEAKPAKDSPITSNLTNKKAKLNAEQIQQKENCAKALNRNHTRRNTYPVENDNSNGNSEANNHDIKPSKLTGNTTPNSTKDKRITKVDILKHSKTMQSLILNLQSIINDFPNENEIEKVRHDSKPLDYLCSSRKEFLMGVKLKTYYSLGKLSLFDEIINLETFKSLGEEDEIIISDSDDEFVIDIPDQEDKSAIKSQFNPKKELFVFENESKNKDNDNRVNSKNNNSTNDKNDKKSKSTDIFPPVIPKLEDNRIYKLIYSMPDNKNQKDREWRENTLAIGLNYFNTMTISIIKKIPHIKFEEILDISAKINFQLCLNTWSKFYNFSTKDEFLCYIGGLLIQEDQNNFFKTKEVKNWLNVLITKEIEDYKKAKNGENNHVLENKGTVEGNKQENIFSTSPNHDNTLNITNNNSTANDNFTSESAGSATTLSNNSFYNQCSDANNLQSRYLDSYAESSNNNTINSKICNEEKYAGNFKGINAFDNDEINVKGLQDKTAKARLYGLIGTPKNSPKYDILEYGNIFDKQFKVSCKLNDQILGIGIGKNTKEAGIRAAMIALREQERIFRQRYNPCNSNVSESNNDCNHASNMNDFNPNNMEDIFTLKSYITKEVINDNEFDVYNVLPISEDFIDYSAREKLYTIIMNIKKVSIPPRYEINKIGANFIQSTFVLNNIPIAKSIGANKKKASQVVAMFLLKNPKVLNRFNK